MNHLNKEKDKSSKNDDQAERLVALHIKINKEIPKSIQIQKKTRATKMMTQVERLAALHIKINKELAKSIRI